MKCNNCGAEISDEARFCEKCGAPVSSDAAPAPAAGEAIPAPTPVQDLSPEAGAAVALIEVFMPPVRDRINNRVVKKTLTIPAWLNREAEAAHVNFSQILQEGLKRYLGQQ